MNKKYVIFFSIFFILIGISFWQYSVYSKEKQMAEVEEFKNDNERLVYDIFYYSPDIPNEEKRASLKKRMETSLVDSMCPPLPQLNQASTQPVNELIKMKTKELKETSKGEREVVTTFTIQTPEGGEFPQKVKARYQKKHDKWIMFDIQPISE